MGKNWKNPFKPKTKKDSPSNSRAAVGSLLLSWDIGFDLVEMSRNLIVARKTGRRGRSNE
jgi:hypothetical protein